MTRLVLDTNVLVSGVLSPHGPPGQLLELVLAGNLALIADARILSEYAEVLSRPHLGFDSHVVRILLDTLETCTTQLVAPPWPHPLPDPSDEPFLAVAALADVPLITGNLRRYPPESRGNTVVLTPREFYERLRQRME